MELLIALIVVIVVVALLVDGVELLTPIAPPVRNVMKVLILLVGALWIVLWIVRRAGLWP